MARKRRKSGRRSRRGAKGRKGRKTRRRSRRRYGLRANRENMFHTAVLGNKLNWSPWQLAMRDKIPPKAKRNGKWAERNNGRPGMKNTSLFKTVAGEPGIYEFAVRAIKDPARRKCVVYNKPHKGFEGKPWDSTLLKGDKCADEIDDALESGCELYARRAPLKKIKFNKRKLKSLNSFSKALKDNYDYGWQLKPHMRADPGARHRAISGSVKDLYYSHRDVSRKGSKSRSRSGSRTNSRSGSKARVSKSRSKSRKSKSRSKSRRSKSRRSKSRRSKSRSKSKRRSKSRGRRSAGKRKSRSRNKSRSKRKSRSKVKL